MCLTTSCRRISTQRRKPPGCQLLASNQQPGNAQVQASDALTSDQADAILGLVAAAEREDGVAPLSEHAVLHLRHGSDAQARDVLLWRANQLAGYGHLDLSDEGPAGEMLIRPADRRRGLGLILVQTMFAAAGDDLRLWAHGDLAAASGLAAVTGLQRVRALWQMRRPLAEPIPEPRIPAGITLRTFRPGQDEDAWVAVNHAAFAHHPEQGAWTTADLEMREHEPWFDPAGFFLAERAGRLAGFHWTKVHAGSDPVGEVYVVGVDPAEQGTGLGRALTLTGLQYLRDQGLPAVMLYVDESNIAAIRLYESLGFTRWHTDVMYAKPAPSPAAPASLRKD
jgi:mycothiol synthase